VPAMTGVRVGVAPGFVHAETVSARATHAIHLNCRLRETSSPGGPDNRSNGALHQFFTAWTWGKWE